MSENQNIDCCCEEKAEAADSCPYCSGKHKERDEAEFKNLIKYTPNGRHI